MKALDPGIRDAVLRAHKRGTAPSKLAEKYGIPIGTVKSWIQRSKVAPKKRVKDAPKGAGKDAKRVKPEPESPGQTQRRPGAPLGNQNAVGNIGGGAPLGNKNAVVTHAYESILFDVLSDEEKEAWLRVNTEKLAQLDTEIRTAEIRERRMLQDINQLRQAEHTMVSYEVESEGPGNEDTDEQGAGEQEAGGRKVRQKFDGTLGQIQRIQDALTRVQASKARLIKLRNECEELELRRKELELKNW